MYFHDDCQGGNHPLSFYFLQALIDIEYTVTNLKQSARAKTTQIIKNVLIGLVTRETRLSIFILEPLTLMYNEGLSILQNYIL